MHQKGGAAIDAGLEQVDALFGGRPAIYDEVVKFFAKKFVNDSFVFAAGERTIIDPQERHFRYAMVYGGNAAVDLVQ